MKHVLLVGMAILLCISFATANVDLYQSENIDLQLTVSGVITPTADTNAARLRELSADVYLVPQQDHRQSTGTFSTDGKNKGGTIAFRWDDGIIEAKPFSYTTQLRTNLDRVQVSHKVPFPVTDISGFEQYTIPTKKIDSDNAAIAAQAQALVAGHDDLFAAVFAMARWVSQNIEYDLNELTTDTAQSASWVLNNRQGVCDEMTSLFVAMARSQGIPAKFVSGISYTENADVLAVVGSNWAPHGWAEVYFPDVGWVSFDITFDEYGYIDGTHIKLHEKQDTDDPDVAYRWLAQDVSLRTSPLNLSVQILNPGTRVQEPLELEMSILEKEVGFGSYNVIKGILHNTANYYTATTVELAVPSEVTVEGINKKAYLLKPKEIREVFWTIKLSEGLNAGFVYEFPVVMYSEKNVSITDAFSARQDRGIFEKQEIKEIIVEENKPYSRQVGLECQPLDDLATSTLINVTCTITNAGKKNLVNVRICAATTCTTKDLAPASSVQITHELATLEPGWQHLVISAINEDIDRRMPFVYQVMDQPKIDLNVQTANSVVLGEKVELKVLLEKASFSTPGAVRLAVRGPRLSYQWEHELLTQNQEIALDLGTDTFGVTTPLYVTLEWEDANHEKFFTSQDLVITSQATGFSQKVKIYFNTFLNMLS